MADLCPKCGVNLVMVGRSHLCIPKKGLTVSGLIKPSTAVGDGVSLTSIPHPPGLIDKMADAISSGKLSTSKSTKEPQWPSQAPKATSSSSPAKSVVVKTSPLPTEIVEESKPPAKTVKPKKSLSPSQSSTELDGYRAYMRNYMKAYRARKKAPNV